MADRNFVTFEISDELLKALDTYCDREEGTRSFVVRKALREYLKRELGLEDIREILDKDADKLTV